MRRPNRWIGILVAALAWHACPAWAQERQRVGIRAGVSGDPNQFFVGGHTETSPLARGLTFRPNAELGVGDGVVVAANLEFVHSIPLSDHPWRLYLGAGPGLVIASGQGRRDDDDIGGGFNILVGAQRRTGLFGELKVGVIDSPEVKVTVGYAFR